MRADIVSAPSDEPDPPVPVWRRLVAALIWPAIVGAVVGAGVATAALLVHLFT